MLEPSSTNRPVYSGYIPSSGYFAAPSDVYFAGAEFTITVWTYVYSVEMWSRVLDFGNGSPRDNVEISLSTRMSGNIGMVVFDDAEYPDYTNPQSRLPLLAWMHLAAVLKDATVSVYVNMSLVFETKQQAPRNVVRTRNYIGKSNWDWHSLVNAKFRNLRIYNRALALNEILVDLKS